MVRIAGQGFRWRSIVSSTSPAEVTLIEPLLAVRVRRKPRWLIHDRAADSDPLRERLSAEASNW